jgi:hypothetical protein
MSEHERDELSSKERALLDHWRAPEPPSDLVDRAIAELGAAPPSEPRGRRGRWAPAAAAAMIAAGVIGWWILSPARPSEGSLTASTRTTVALGDRAVAVLDAGARLVWRVSPGGAAAIEQPAGEVFYRVDRGGPFVVTTPEGTVEVTGTCFSVEVTEMKTTSAAWSGAAAGAALATLVTVTVYEGSVVTRAAGEQQALGAGMSGTLSRGGPPAPARDRKEATARAGAARDRDDLDRREARAERPGIEGSAAGGELPARVENAELKARVAQLEAELHEVKAKSRDRRTYDLTQEQLEQMASRCELRWDHPPLSAEPNRIRPEDAEALGLTAEERAAVDRSLAEFHRSMRADLEALYKEATGDPNAGSLSMEAMIDEVLDKTPHDELKVIYQRLAQERAGQRPPPDPSSLGGVTERLMRRLTGAGDRMEAALGEAIGPEGARGLRDLHQGFGSRSASTVGCPATTQ